MTEACTTGTWRPKAGHEQEFVAALTVFADWAAGMPGAGTLRFPRDDADPGRFVSFGVWQSNEAMRVWKISPDFRKRMSLVQHHVDALSLDPGLEPGELTVVATPASAAAPLTQGEGPR
jgi:heme-degrading monooxygenase HmoA